MDKGNAVGDGSAGDGSADAPQISGFYGPGSILAWKMLLISLIATAINRSRSKVSNVLLSAEFIAVIAYPTIAAGDLLLKLKRIPYPDWPAIWELQSTAYYSSQELFESIPDRTDEELGPLSQLLGLLVPLEILGFYYPLSLILLAMFGFTWSKHTLLRKRAFGIVFGLPTLWCWSIIFYAVPSIYDETFWGLLLFFILWFWTPVLIPCIAFAILCLAVAINMAIWALSALWFELASMLAVRLTMDIEYLRKQLWHLYRIFSYFLPVSLFLLVCLSYPWGMYYMCQSGVLFTNIGIPLMELDQAATLFGGIVTLLYSLYDAMGWELIKDICGGTVRLVKDGMRRARSDLQEAEAYYVDGYWNPPKQSLPKTAL
jgi:hypothetical protein